MPASCGSAASLGPDADGDGAGDVAIAMTDTETRAQRVVLFRGGTDEILHTWGSDNWQVVYGHQLAVVEDLDGDRRADVLVATSSSIVDEPGEPVIATHVFSGADGSELAAWSHAEPRYLYPTGVAAGAAAGGCAGLVAIGVLDQDLLDDHRTSWVELRRLAPR